MTIYLSSTESIKLTSTIASTVDVYVSYVDLNTSTNVVTPSRQATNITTATTTTIVSAPSANNVRKVKSIRIRNKSNLFDTNITVYQTNSTTDYQIFADNIGPGKTLLIQNNTNKLLNSGGIQTPKWHGVLYGAFGDGNPNTVMAMIQNNGVASINPNTAYVDLAGGKLCRACFFYLPQAITVKNIRFYGTGNTTDRLAATIYERGVGTAWTRLFSEIVFSTAANTWGTVNSGDLSLSLTANKMYMMGLRAVSAYSQSALLCLGRGNTAYNSMNYVPVTYDMDYAYDYLQTISVAFPTVDAVFPATLNSLTYADYFYGSGTAVGMMGAFFLDSN
jgi:hypothetical protein